MTLLPRSDANRVLVVEDDRRLRDMLVASVAEMGLVPTAAPTAEAALRLAAAAEAKFAVAVVDLNLPGMGGLDLCDRLRADNRPPEVVILTGFGDLDAARRAIRLGAVDFLTKPCGMGELEQALARARQRWLDRWFRDAPPPPPSSPPPPPPPEAAAAPPTAGHPMLDDAERRLILDALARHHGNRELAAAEVGVSVRTLYYRLKQYQRADAATAAS